MLCAVHAKLNLIRTILESRSDFAFMPSASNPKPLFNKRGERANKLQLIAILTHFHVTHRSTRKEKAQVQDFVDKLQKGGDDEAAAKEQHRRGRGSREMLQKFHSQL